MLSCTRGLGASVFLLLCQSKDTPLGCGMAEGFKRDRDTPQLRSPWERWHKTGTAGQH